MSGLGISVSGMGYKIISQDFGCIGIYSFVYRNGDNIKGILFGNDDRNKSVYLGTYGTPAELTRVLQEIADHDMASPYIMPQSDFGRDEFYR
jgi:hypothetical protein